MSATIAIFVIIFLALLGIPFFAVFALAALYAFYVSNIDLSAVAVEVYRIASWPTLVTIPLFTFGGYVMAASKSPERIIRLADASLGNLPGGVAVISLIICAFFTAFTGASGVTIIALGGLLYPMLKSEGYSERFSLGLVTTSGSLGLLFPPSLPIILYAIVSKIHVDRLFLAGLVPGSILIAVLSIWAVINNKKPKSRAPFDHTKFFSALKGSFFECLLPIGILVGIYGGYTTVMEAAALSTAYIIVIECFIYRDVHFFKDIPRIITKSMSLVGAILLILCCAMGLTNYLVDADIPAIMFNSVKEYLTNKYSFLLFLNIFLLLVGAVMDIFSAIIVITPLIIPIAEEFGIHPIHLAIIFLTNLEIGFITPPIGINLFISSFKFRTPITALYRSTIPYLLLLIASLALFTYVPQLSLIWE